MSLSPASADTTADAAVATPKTPRRRTRLARTAVATASAGLLVSLALIPAAAAQAAPRDAASGSVAAASAPSLLTDIRTGSHPTFDRIVLDFAGNVPAYGSTGGPDQLTNCASGQTVPLTGTEYTEITTTNAAAHDDNGNPTYTGPRVVYTPQLAKVTGFAVTCDFEGHLNVGFATTAGVTEIHTFPLSNPSRIVVDVHHG
ncbi:hypothetical protein LO772_09650 [Yinghuangia sp. ASG 101]|uniref:AMIN-like domain-containing (lipo)protein n=1 Tax=Yinghuangia sp. ASG 101 TaxID=2896848 RepID=UPI001E41DC65|nr:hypothetical protein [Yinghuangia sp. ASG 101]UGQ13828.1 hypothetical protein LO772_09650 [Yinghuangia sp. ASG 101]